MRRARGADRAPRDDRRGARARSRSSSACAGSARWRCGSSAARRTPASSRGGCADHPAVARVRYPGLADDPGHELAARQMSGFGAMIAFEVDGGAEAADAVCAGVERIANATSLGGVETLVERRARYPEEQEHVPGEPDPAVGRLRARRGPLGGPRAGARPRLVDRQHRLAADAPLDQGRERRREGVGFGPLTSASREHRRIADC